MGVEWNKCFICFEGLGWLKSNRRGKRRRTSGGEGNGIRVLLDYLLRGQRAKGDGNEILVGQIVDMIRNGDGAYRLCGKCEAVSSSISKLHLELEVIQMKIISLVDNVRREISNCSRISFIAIDREGGGKSEDTNELKMEDSESELMEIVHSFQNAVAECEPPKQVPFVLLERCLGVSAAQARSSPRAQIERGLVFQRISSSPDGQIKTEPEDSGIGNEDIDDLNTPSFMDSLDSPSSPVPASQKKVLQYEYHGKQTKRVRIPVKRKQGKVKKRTPNVKVKLKKTPQKKIFSETNPKKRRSYRDKNKYSCDTCKVCPTLSFHRFHFHLKTHETGEKRFHCDTCPNDVWLSGQQLYDLHQECHHRKLHLAFCDFCSERFDTFFLKDHMMTCSKGPPHPRKIFFCPNCTFAGSTREKLLRHLQEHDVSAQFICDICSEECPTRVKLVAHLVQVHKVLEEFQCSYPDCNRTFADKQQLIRHETVHARKFACQYCDRACNSPANLKVHERIHTDERPITCSECGEGCASKEQLKRHMIYKHGAPKPKCEVCGKEYSDQQLLKNHMRLHTGDLLSCDQCGAKFLSKGSLQIHMETHSTQLVFTCEQCGKAFSNKKALRKHHKTHSTERPFECEYCGKAFRLQSFLIEHLRTHTKERPFVCEICGAGFTQPHSLKTHKLKHS